MPLAAIAFYIGLIGPIAAFVFMPEEYGFLHLRKFLHANANQIYPMMHYCDRFAPSEIMYVIDQYEDGWISLAESRSRQK